MQCSSSISARIIFGADGVQGLHGFKVDSGEFEVFFVSCSNYTQFYSGDIVNTDTSVTALDNSLNYSVDCMVLLRTQVPFLKAVIRFK